MPDRIIKESICTSDTLNALPWFEQVFFHRLTVVCDDYGRFDARPKILKSRLFPLRDDVDAATIDAAIQALHQAGLIQLYQVEDKPYLYLTTWEKYQRVRAKRSKYPPPADTCRHLPADDGKCPRNPIQSNPNPIQCESGSDTATCGQAPAAAGRLCRDYEKYFGNLPRAAVEDIRQYLAEGMEEGLLGCILSEVAAAEPRSPVKYMQTVVGRCRADGIKTAEQFAQSNKRDAVPGRGAGRAAQPDLSDPKRYEKVSW